MLLLQMALPPKASARVPLGDSDFIHTSSAIWKSQLLAQADRCGELQFSLKMLTANWKQRKKVNCK